MRSRLFGLFLVASIWFLMFPVVILAGPTVNGKIVFVSERDGNREIYVMNPDGSTQTRLTNDPRKDDFPVWSPDGKTIAFCRDDGSVYSFYSIWLMNYDGTDQRQIFHSCEGPLTWSPNGQQLAMNTWWGGIGILSLDGTYEGPIDTGFGKGGTWDVAWSPDGSGFAFSGAGGGSWSAAYLRACIERPGTTSVGA